jgi:hypothetical protein
VETRRQIVRSLAAKTGEAIERTDHLVGLVPEGSGLWSPAIPAGRTAATDLGHLLGHLLDCLAGFCACFERAFPGALPEGPRLRSLEVNHLCDAATARERIRAYRPVIERGFSLCADEDLKRLLPTVFVPAGESLLTLLLGNLEHLLNHKYQLFFYLKLLGVDVRSSDLYEFRGG